MNRKSTKDRAQIIRCLVEGNSIRSTVCLTGASKNTVVKLLAEVGEACEVFQFDHLRNLNCSTVQVDEIWSFVYAKQAKVKKLKADKAPGEAGDLWTWTAIDADSKLVVSYFVGRRGAKDAFEFIGDLKSRLAHRIQLTSDGHKAYLKPIGKIFGDKIDYAMLIKLYGDSPESEKRYSPPQCTGTIVQVIAGDPDPDKISTSYAERCNLTMRMSMRRFTRLTNGFSKKVDNHIHALALHFMYYNFCRIHSSIKRTPAMAAGVVGHQWTIEDLIEMTDLYWRGENALKISN